MIKKRILLADDEIDITVILKMYLQLDGYEVTVCNNGRDAYDQLMAGQFDLAILDVMMPEMTGWEVCRILKDDPNRKALPVVILSARAQNEDREKSSLCGANEYISKPFDYPVVSATIKKLLASGAQTATP